PPSPPATESRGCTSGRPSSARGSRSSRVPAPGPGCGCSCPSRVRGAEMAVPLKAGILLADDHEMVRDGLALVLDSAPDLEVAGVASDGVEALRAVLDGEFDLAVLDVSMPKMTGINVARELARQRPDVRVV